MKYIKLFLFLITGISSSAAWSISFELVETQPVCDHQGHQKTWCDANDVPASVAAAGLETRILAQLDQALREPTRSHVRIAMFSFSNKSVQAKLCQLGHAGVRVDIFVDFGSSKDVAFVNDINCQKNISQPTLVAKFLGGFNEFPDWRLHHNKTVVVDAGDNADLTVNFSSGNLSIFGTSIHMDHWVMMRAERESNLVKASLCLFESLTAANQKAEAIGMYIMAKPDFSKDPEVIATFQSNLLNCYQRDQLIPAQNWTTALAKEEIAPFFTPMKGNFAVRAIREQIDNVKAQFRRDGKASLAAASDHFTIKEIATRLVEAASLGVEVRVLLPSSVLSGSEGTIQDRIFYYRTFKPSAVKVRFVEINEPGKQHMHHKFLVFNGQRIFSGAGNFTNAGLTGNFESLYLTQNAALTAEYQKLFDELWSNSLDERSVRRR